ncbi:MAG: hypothetical protein PHZ07_01355 [Patescibacteria group bacterium]|nr:hypothetical protein [Patescibacteria group bacterium]MDD4303917.1 hypothetical protein [Patescibacteria group bacterium]MDD4695096.1 hypothetical protein [Patescibacteria group bacterium]
MDEINKYKDSIEYIENEFQKIIKENPLNFDKEYLSQIRFKVTSFKKGDDQSYDVNYEIKGFDYGDDYSNGLILSSRDGLSIEEEIAKSIYDDIVMGTDLMRKDPKVRECIDRAEEEAEEILENKKKKDKKKFWGWARPEIGKGHHLGDCHIFWEEKKRILKEKYNIDWKTPAEINPSAKFD